MASIVTLTMNPALDIATSTERVVPTEKLRCDEPRYDPGGGGINVARAVHMLGGDAVAVFPAGGLSGQMLIDLLANEQVPHSPVAVAGITRTSLAVFERQRGDQYRFLLPGALIGGHDQERCLDVLASKLAGASFFVASGSLPPGVQADFYSRVNALAREHNLRFVLDTSGPALTGAGSGHFLIKTSLEELEQLAGARLTSKGEEERAARSVIEAGVSEILVLSLGARGALLVTPTETHRFASIPVTAAAGSVGAGDSMVAGIVLSLERGWALVDAVKFGMAAGAAASLRPGTELCDPDDTQRLFEMMTKSN